MTPQQAADIAGVSRKSIMDAINALKINAKRDNRNRWQIEDEELRRWMDTRPIRKVADSTTEVAVIDSVEVSVLSERLAAAQRETEMYCQQLKISEAEKARLMDLLTEAQRRRSLWEVLFGQGSS
jgi:hypothetical protein